MMMQSSQKHSLSPNEGDEGQRPSKRSRGEVRLSETPSHAKIIEDMRYKLTKACNESFRKIMERPSVKDGPNAAEIQAHHVASFQAHSRHIVDYFYPSLKQTGEVVSFGGDDCFQLGITTDPDAEKEEDYPPTLIPKINLDSYHIKSIECGGGSSFAISYEGVVYSWGLCDEGQLGRGEITTEEIHKIGIVPLDNVIQVAAGNTHTVFLDVDGQVFVAGQYYSQEYGKWRDANTLKDLDRGEGEEKDLKPNSVPYHITGFDQKVIRISAGNNFSAALLEDGETLITWGLGFEGQLARSRSMEAPTTDEEVDEETGETYRTYNYEKPMIGHFEERYDEKEKETYQVFIADSDKVYRNFLVPMKVDWEEEPKNCKRKILDFSCGDSHLLVVARDTDTFETRVYCAGRNHNGQLGLGDRKLRHALTAIKDLDNKRICKVSAGSTYSLALNALGNNVWGWGSSKDGVLGLFDEFEMKKDIKTFAQPQLIAFPKSLEEERIIDITSGDNHNFAITNKFNVFSWGFNVYGQTGIYSEVLEIVGRPRKLFPMETVKLGNPGATKCQVLRAAAGGQHSLLLIKRFK